MDKERRCFIRREMSRENDQGVYSFERKSARQRKQHHESVDERLQIQTERTKIVASH
jgi:hypothetical protein